MNWRSRYAFFVVKFKVGKAIDWWHVNSIRSPDLSLKLSKAVRGKRKAQQLISIYRHSSQLWALFPEMESIDITTTITNLSTRWEDEKGTSHIKSHFRANQWSLTYHLVNHSISRWCQITVTSRNFISTGDSQLIPIFSTSTSALKPDPLRQYRISRNTPIFYDSSGALMVRLWRLSNNHWFGDCLEIYRRLMATVQRNTSSNSSST